jgi:hypothetical protein
MPTPPSVNCLSLRVEEDLNGFRADFQGVCSTKSRPCSSLLSGLSGSSARALIVHAAPKQPDPQCVLTRGAACRFPVGGADLAVLTWNGSARKRLAIGPRFTIISVRSLSVRQCAVSRGDRRVCDSLRLPYRTRTSLRRSTNRAPATPLMGFYRMRLSQPVQRIFDACARECHTIARKRNACASSLWLPSRLRYICLP